MKLPSKVTYRTASLKTLKTLRDAICPRCKKNREVQLAWEAVVKKVLLDKRNNENMI